MKLWIILPVIGLIIGCGTSDRAYLQRANEITKRQDQRNAEEAWFRSLSPEQQVKWLVAKDIIDIRNGDRPDGNDHLASAEWLSSLPVDLALEWRIHRREVEAKWNFIVEARHRQAAEEFHRDMEEVQQELNDTAKENYRRANAAYENYFRTHR